MLRAGIPNDQVVRIVEMASMLLDTDRYDA